MSGHVSCLRVVIGAKCLLCRDVGRGRKGLDFKAAQAWTSGQRNLQGAGHTRFRV